MTHLTSLVLITTVASAVGWVVNPVSPLSCTRTSTQAIYRNDAVGPLMATGKGKNAQQRKVDDFVEFMNKPMDSMVDPADTAPGAPNEDELAGFVKCVVKAADMRKAEDISAIRVSKVTSLTSFVIIVSGNSRPQNQAIAAAIIDEVKEEFDDRKTRSGVPEGNADSGWILLDYGEVMVHIMTPKSRLFYDIDGRWEEGESMDLSDVLVPNFVEQETTSSSDHFDLEKEDDPFWS
mmetsp:Transcript_39402/g.57919  ORF Transcript_39402/g.57919 Transcript_39402/m.57919 type:complete len:235 (+) Transcript_39402:34-738(+)|eukprot:CAMPEP_0195521796 /NCGR_PEP_ID=MMETSP0794_2-20130614/19364_1 /TAXON_ID=515487 /ORGANISM="Stephanopyxis turris, Strain CCMP 815" /LENGTH=234 /DNA_ID=CAMNT_0040651417 /DNA_START=22 /DNA_END=726 /DNA_ORIENTATION=+